MDLRTKYRQSMIGGIFTIDRLLLNPPTLFVLLQNSNLATQFFFC